MQAKVYLNFKFFKIFSNLLISEIESLPEFQVLQDISNLLISERMVILISNNLLKYLETVILPIS